MFRPALCTTRTQIKEIAGIDIDAITERTAIDLDEVGGEFWDAPVSLQDRDLEVAEDGKGCEVNPEYQQILGYVTVTNSEDKVFVYGRGKGGGEPGLHGKLSIGLGGHIETLPNSDNDLVQLDDYPELLAHVILDAERELKEEAGLIDLEIDPVALLVDPVPDGKPVPVGSVHLGVWCLTQIEGDVGELEEGVITRGEWWTLEQLEAAKDRFEPWSQMAIGELRNLVNGGELSDDEGSVEDLDGIE